MNTQEYIASGVLELYIFDQLSLAERKEVEAMCASNPAIKLELEQLEDSINAYAVAHAKTPKPGLKTEIFSQLNFEDATSPRVVSMQPTRGFSWLAAASIALLVGSSFIGFKFYQQLETTKTTVALLQEQTKMLLEEKVQLSKQVAIFSTDLLVLQDTSNVKIPLQGLPLSPASRALVYWNTIRKETYINISQLPPLSEEKQYQLWAIVEGKPVDLGVLPSDKTISNLVHLKDVNTPQAFAITIEPKGGSVNPTLDMMVVMGKL